MQKKYKIENIDFYRTDIFNTNPVKDAEDLNIWFTQNDQGTAFIECILVDENMTPINLENIDINLNWQLSNREKRIQELGITKLEDVGKILIEIPSEIINGKPGKNYFTITLNNSDNSLTSGAFLVTIVDSLSDSEIVGNELLTKVKDAERFDGKTYQEVTEDIASKVGSISTEGLASEEYVDNAVKNLASEEFVNNSINDATNGLATEKFVEDAIQNIPEVDLSGYVLDSELSNVAKSGNYTDLEGKPILEFKNTELNIDELQYGSYYVENVRILYSKKDQSIGELSGIDNGVLLVGKKISGLINFTIIIYQYSGFIIYYSKNGELARLSDNDIVVRNDIQDFASNRDIENAIEELQNDISNENIAFRDTIYQAIIDTFSKVPETYLSDYATSDYVNNAIAQAIQDLPSGGGGDISKEEVENLINEKLVDYYNKTDIDVRLKQYVTNQELELKNYLTIEEGDERYMPYVDKTIDDYKPNIGEYKTVLKGDFFKYFYEITDFWPTNVTNNHELRRPLWFLNKIPGTDRYIIYVGNYQSEHEKGFSIFHFVTNKSIEEDIYVKISELGLAIPDNITNIRFKIAKDKPLINVTYYTATKEAKSALLSINTENWAISVDDEVVIKDSSYGAWLTENFSIFSNDIAITKEFDRIGYIFNKTNDITALNLVFYDINFDEESSKYKFENKIELPSYYSDFGGYFSSNFDFIDKNHIIIGYWNKNSIMIGTIDDAENIITYDSYTVNLTAEFSKIINNYLFIFGSAKYSEQALCSCYKINSDYTIEKTDILNDISLKDSLNPWKKYCPYGTGPTFRANYDDIPAYRPTFVRETENAIYITHTGYNYDLFYASKAGTICFNKVTEKFEYFYPNFSNYNRQLTDFIIDGQKGLGVYKNKIFIFDILKEEPLVVKAGSGILYSYANCGIPESQQSDFEEEA
ncbi:hypothetical protein B5E87_00260 [Massilimicrobiota sp. An142]|uniref:BppU family phage baseplate upper protein n=1 Tax=Massilimicrobiota sp. An142 TaxID=1965564 RepID=UPI000B38A21A|nr:BppU family phage baseplate upper protein [Massilimicrobiota sp. An142]OUQ15038.1 hypothetical protein B5E87_00260 [Massilimicrobiota sp. An142]